MATVNNKQMILKMLANKGIYQEDDEADPAAYYIYSYHSPLAGGERYSVMYRDTQLFPSQFVLSPILLMSKGELTEDGQTFLEVNNIEVDDKGDHIDGYDRDDLGESPDY